MIIEKQYLMQLDEVEYDKLMAILWWTGGGAVYPEGGTQAQTLQENAMEFWNELQGE